MPVTIIYELIPLDPDRPHGQAKIVRDGKIIARHLKHSTAAQRITDRAHGEAFRLTQGDSVVIRQPGDNPGVVRESVVTPELARQRARNLDEWRRRAWREVSRANAEVDTEA